MGMSGTKTTILIASDLHYKEGYHKGVYEGGAKDWITKRVERYKPDYLILLGDLGQAWTQKDLAVLMNLAKVYSIAGNHDDIDLFKNMANRGGEEVLIYDGEVKQIGGLKFGFINGMVGPNDGLQSKSAEDYLKICEKLKEEKIDVLCTHASPLRNAFMEFKSDINLNVSLQAHEMIKPKLSFTGHIHPEFGAIGEKVGESKIQNFAIDSSQKGKIFAVMEIPGKSPSAVSVQIVLDSRPIESYTVPLKEEEPPVVQSVIQPVTQPVIQKKQEGPVVIMLPLERVRPESERNGLQKKKTADPKPLSMALRDPVAKPSPANKEEEKSYVNKLFEKLHLRSHKDKEKERR
jgi:Icc-related predicted phosphoesterase